MATNRVAATASAVTLTLATEVAVVTVAPAAPGSQVTGGNVLITAFLVVTGAASATTCTVKVRRGSGTGGTDILASDAVFAVTAAATDTMIGVQVTDTAAGFNGASGVYTVTATAAGAAQAARLASLEIQPVSAGV